jgi:hypothetical protein
MNPDIARLQLVFARQAREEANKANKQWYEAILDALAAGVSVAEVALLAGCTRQRIYQIKDGTY